MVSLEIRSREISFKIKFNLYNSLILPTLLYGSETWNLLEESTIDFFEFKSHRRMLNITYRQRKANVYIHEEIISRIGSYERILQKVKRRKISWFGHMSRHDTLENTILQGRVEGTRKKGRPKRNSIYDGHCTGIYTRYLLGVMKYHYSWEKLFMMQYHVPPYDDSSWD